MVNASLNWASIVGIVLAVCGGGLYFLRSFKPALARGEQPKPIVLTIGVVGQQYGSTSLEETFEWRATEGESPVIER